MAAIVYEGVGIGGALFADLKFFILQRVPSRDTWKSLIESNGGEIVKLEKNADFVIADHARKDCPEGSVSWKFIEQSVKRGALQDVEDHRAGQAKGAGISRAVGSGQPKKFGRTPFSAEDDRVLMEWTMDAERQGLAVKGNEIFKQLGEHNTRHTWQSWRDRWVKYVSHQKRPDPSNDPESDLPEPDEGPQPRARPVPKPRTVPQPTQQSSTPLPARNRPEGSSAARPRPANTTRSTSSPYLPEGSPVIIYKSKNFTKEERNLLRANYEAIMNLDKDKFIDAWVTWAIYNPTHTAQEWSNYFNKKIRPEVEALEKITTNGKSKISSLSSKKAQSSSIGSKPPSKTETRPNISNAASENVESSAVQLKPLAKETAKVVGIRDSQGSSKNTLRLEEVKKAVVDPTTVDETKFKDALIELAEGLSLEMNLTPFICGRKVPLFRFWQVVKSDEFGGYNEVTGRKLWSHVAAKLNFNQYQHPTAAKDLKDCYDEILVDFEAVRDDYMQEFSEVTDSQEQALIESQLRQTAARETQGAGNLEQVDEEGDYGLKLPPSSPPQRLTSSSNKRAIGTELSYDDSPYNKRPRLDKGKGKVREEVPSTPDDVIYGFQRIPVSARPSPLKSFARPELETDIEADDVEEVSFKPIKQPKFSQRAPKASQQRGIDPETQDFSFPNVNQGDKGELSFLSSSLPSPSRAFTQPLTNRSPAHNPVSGGEPTQSPSQSSPPKVELFQEFVDSHIALGYTEEIVMEALTATTMETGNASLVMEALMQRTGIPEDIPGVWTWLDDKVLMDDVGSDELERVIKKHGEERIEVRRRFLLEQMD